jgi:hypothetical protein
MQGMKRIICLLGLLLISGLAQAQSTEGFSIRASNLLRWAEGNAIIQGREGTKNWFENVTDVYVSYKDLQIGLRHALYRPSEFGEELGGIQALNFKYLQYTHSALDLTVGNFYATVGRGLAVNLYRDYTLNYDSNLSGVKVLVSTDKFSALAFRGRSYPSLGTATASSVREADLQGAMLKGTPIQGATVGGYYIMVPFDSTLQNYPDTRMPGGFLDLKLPFGVGFYGETALQYVREDHHAAGVKNPYYGNYLALDYSFAGIGIVADYKDYNFKKYPPPQNSTVTYNSEPLAYQNPPIVQREFTTSLLGKHPHLLDLSDEVGFQIEASGSPCEPLSLAVNFSRSSTHRGGSVMPSLHQEDAPFWQLFTEADYAFPQGHFLRLDLGVNEEALPASWPQKQGGSVEGTYLLTKIYGLTAHIEAMHLKDLIKDQNYWESFWALTLSRTPWGSITAIAETSGNPEENKNRIGDQNVWLGGELSVTFMQKHNLLLFVGQERGGLKCTSGRCRIVDPFDGVKLQLKSTF